MFDHIHSDPASTVYAAIELSKKTWVVAILRPGKVQPSLHRIKGGSFAELVMRLRAASNDERLLVYYEAGYDGSLRANDDETNACREFTLEGVGQTSNGYAPNQRQQDPCSGRRR